MRQRLLSSWPILSSWPKRRSSLYALMLLGGMASVSVGAIGENSSLVLTGLVIMAATIARRRQQANPE
jgi:hypothetical protein